MIAPTPRTDAEEYLEGEGQSLHVVSADFARTLERELTTERATLAGVNEIKRGVEAELAEMKRRLSSEKLMYKLANDSVIKHEWAAGELQNELATEREKVRLLRDACDQICDEWGRNHDANPIGAGQRMSTRAGKALEATEDAP